MQFDSLDVDETWHFVKFKCNEVLILKLSVLAAVYMHKWSDQCS